MLKRIIQIMMLGWAALFYSCSQQEECLTVSFTGDVLLDRGVRKKIEKKGVADLFKSVSPLFHSSDAVVINLECPVTNSVSPVNKKYIFRAEPEWMRELHEAGVTHAALANNHTVDQGRSGLTDTYQNVLSSGITPLGYGETSSKSCRPVLLTKGAIRVALFNAVTLPLENWVYLENHPGICQASIPLLEEKVKDYKQEHPKDYVVVILHWGIEFQSSPTLSQRKAAHRLIDAGTDAIIGHHPHVIQKEEYYQEKPIFYSLGNFIFDQHKPETSKTVIVQLHFRKHQLSVTAHPVAIKACKPHI